MESVHFIWNSIATSKFSEPLGEWLQNSALAYVKLQSSGAVACDRKQQHGDERSVLGGIGSIP